MERGQYNWFEVADSIEQHVNDTVDASVLQNHLDEFYRHVQSLPMSSIHKNLIKQSHAAYAISLPDIEHCRTAAALNGEIVSDSESDNAEGYIGILSIADECAKRIIARKRKSLARRVRRQKAKTLAARKFLSRKVSRRVNTIVDQFPDIGEKIESFVSESNIGADAWRRTGVLTFDGNLRVNKKVTYERIRQHLIDTYHHNFSYGTIIQLCVARNRRRRPRRIIEGWPRLQREEPQRICIAF